MSQKETEKRVAAGVYVRTSKKGVQSIRIEFCYLKKLCREILKLTPIVINIRKAVRLRRQILQAIASDIFNYAEFFPHSKNVVKFGHIPKQILVKELLDNFLKKAEKKLEVSTCSRYRRVCNMHLYPRFGDLPVKNLSSRLIWEWLEEFKCQRKTIMNMLTPFRAVMADALVYGYIDKDSFERIKISRLQRTSSKYVVSPFNSNEIQKLLSVAEGQIKNIFQFAFFTGLRTSELIGLRWEDIDFSQGIIHVRRAVVGGKEKGTKTKSSAREITLLPSVLAALEAQKDCTLWFNDRIFYNPSLNKPWKSSEQLRRCAWLPLFQKTDVSYRNLYQTRHTFASMMASGGECLAWVSQQMGHETTHTTSRYYVRWVPNPNILGGYKPIHHW
ncbi:MAG: hypothetical protein A3E87_10140 [Gammaproteobacteria bacterium RIFCSPHIGHO2_12_FULL_35_23]|nr:MAG: hypothetical protein A3E87_10140 [Gammaproteobacteria bacterium RIFCSPHIGHO2_12_FULL_35_23]